MQRLILQGGDAEQLEDYFTNFWSADVLAHAYLQVLRKSGPDEPDKLVLAVSHHYPERLLLSHVRELNEALCQMARAGRWHACAELWDQALKLASTFCEIALKSPEPFKRKARLSLMMPSLRVPPTLRKSRKGGTKWIDPFLGDAPAIAKAIELSADTIGAKISDNRVRLGGLCAGLVGRCVHEIKRARSLWSLYFTPYGEMIAWPTKPQIQPFIGQTVDQLLQGMRLQAHSETDAIKRHIRLFCLQADCGGERLHFLLLPELTREQAKVWWKNAIEKMIESKFDSLLQEPLWAKELRDASSGTKADMLKELKDYSRDKVKQFA